MSGYTIRCYQCDGEDNLCTVGLLGDKIECPKSTKSCYKSWTGKIAFFNAKSCDWLIFNVVSSIVETSPLTKRKCADDREYPEGMLYSIAHTQAPENLPIPSIAYS